MKGKVRTALEALIEEQSKRTTRLRNSHSMFPFYNTLDEEKYVKWVARTTRFLRTHFPNDKDIEEFKSTSKRTTTLQQQQELLAILEAFLEYPEAIEKVKTSKVTKSINISNNINNTNTQSQQQSQQQSIKILIKALEDQLSVSQLKEIKQVVEEAKGDLEKAKPKLIDKIKSFGENVASNILANIIANPAIWSMLS